MERLVEHIERLLLWHNCVIIPEFGGFVLQRTPAVCTGDEHLFVPARKEIVFNPTLTHNDGLLTESYMQEYAVDFDEALKYAGTDVADMKEYLEHDRQIKFGRIGMFVKEEKRTVFIPSKKNGELFCPSFYGLPVFYYLSLAALRPSICSADNAAGGSTADSLEAAQSKTNNRANKTESNHIIYAIPVTRTFVSVFAAMVAAIVLFFLISTPVKDVNNVSYSASFVPPEIMPKKSVDEIVFNTFADKDIPGVETDKTAMNTSGDAQKEGLPEMKDGFPSVRQEPEEITVETGTKPDRTVPVTSATKSPASATKSPATSATRTSATAAKSATRSPATSATKTSESAAGSTAATSSARSSASKPVTTNAPASGKFYVIIGSFKTRTKAQEYINRLGNDIAGSAGIIVNDGKVRVYVQQFSNEKQALSYLNKIRQNPAHQQAWLYKRQ
ncbi:MAG: SPOR domain-containing protein [Tannerella sp.]|nr:SPOR domain-containing protein [Tannerella sp.]